MAETARSIPEMPDNPDDGPDADALVQYGESASNDYPGPQPDVHEAAQRFFDLCAEHPEKSFEEQEKDRPYIALDYVNALLEKNSPGVTRFMDDESVRRHIGWFQEKFGTSRPANELSSRVRDGFQMEYMAVAGAFSDRIAELKVAHFVAGKVYESGYSDYADAFAILLTAYGMALRQKIRPY